MVSVRAWLAEHPPALWLRCLEVVVRALNVLLLVLGLGVTAWAVATVVQIGAEQRAHPAPRPPDTKAPPWLADVPWFLPAFGALGAATALTAGVALLGTRLRSPGCMSSSIFGMCLLLTGQACAAVAFFMDRGWQRRLPEIDEQLKQFLAQRLQVCKWVGVGLMLLQLLVLLLGCWLQSVYVAAEEAAEDADDEAAWRRRPLLQQHARRAASPGVGAAGAAADAAGDDSDGWRQRMSERYGLDTRQFTYRPGSSAGGHDAGGQQGAGRSRGCVVM